jgi:hypothetical protein
MEGVHGAGEGDGGEAIIEGAPVSQGPEASVSQAGEYRFFAGWRSDPFFYDAGGALNEFQFTGDDFFADGDICSMVLELPNDELGDGEVGLWHRTLIQADDANWIQVERGARTQVVPFLVPNEEKDAYLGSEPADDARFVGVFAHSLEHLGGYSPEEAKRVAGTFLPDVSSCLLGQRPPAHRQCGRFQYGHLHEREGDRGRGGPTHRPASRVPIPRAATREQDGAVKRPLLQARPGFACEDHAGRRGCALRLGRAARRARRIATPTTQAATLAPSVKAKAYSHASPRPLPHQPVASPVKKQLQITNGTASATTRPTRKPIAAKTTMAAAKSMAHCYVAQRKWPGIAPRTGWGNLSRSLARSFAARRAAAARRTDFFTRPKITTVTSPV